MHIVYCTYNDIIILFIQLCYTKKKKKEEKYQKRKETDFMYLFVCMCSYVYTRICFKHNNGGFTDVI